MSAPSQGHTTVPVHPRAQHETKGHKPSLMCPEKPQKQHKPFLTLLDILEIAWTADNPAYYASLLIFKQRGEVVPNINSHPSLQLFPFIIQPTPISSSDEAKLNLLHITNYCDVCSKSASLPSASWGSAGHSLHGRAFSGPCTCTDCTQRAIIPGVTYVVELPRPVLAGNTC